jgi:hypothetical protein
MIAADNFAGDDATNHGTNDETNGDAAAVPGMGGFASHRERTSH